MIVLLAMLACSPDWTDPQVAARKLPALDPTLGSMAAADVSMLRNQDGCHVYSDRRGTFTDEPRATCVLTNQPTQAFDPHSAAEFDRYTAALEATGVPVEVVVLTRDPAGNVVAIEVSVRAGAFVPLTWEWSAGPPPRSILGEQRVSAVPGRLGWSVVVRDWS